MKTPDAAAVASGQQSLHRVGHCLYRSQESGVYYAILKRAGKQIRRSLKTTDSALARRRLSDLSEKAARLTRAGVGAGKLTLADLGDKWLLGAGANLKPGSYRRQAGIVKALAARFGASPVRGITRGHVEAWAADRTKTAAARSFNTERATLIRLFDYAMREGLVLDNPARVVKRQKPPKGRVVIPTKEQFKALVASIRTLRSDAGEAANLCEFLGYSGCRLAEATSMLWGDVDFTAGQFTVTGGEGGTKNREVRAVPLFPSLEAFMRSLRASLGREPGAGERVFSILSAKKAMTSACTKAGLPRFTHHHLRHFFCSNAIEAGVDFKAIAGWLGHRDGGLLVAKTYGHLRDEHSAAMAKRMTFSAAG